MSTIFALSTAPLKSAVAVVRISGPRSFDILSRLTDARAGRNARREIVPRRATLRTLRHPSSGTTLDQALVLGFEGPHSFTGEDSVELHLHGSRAVIRAVLDAIPRCSTLADDDAPDMHRQGRIRHAEPGEFSKRAFLNGKMDLTQAEGLADIINAETEQQRRVALKQASGSLSRLYDAWRAALIEARAQLEAVIDFGDDADDVHSERAAYDAVVRSVGSLASKIESHLRTAASAGELLRGGIKVAIFGPPNAGKSSLLNLLARRDVSIVSDEPGTTRDIVASTLDIAGYPCNVADTAGLRQGLSVGKVETEGVRRAVASIDAAQLRICVLPLHTKTMDRAELDIDPMSLAQLRRIRTETDPDAKHTIVLLNKVDTIDPSGGRAAEEALRGRYAAATGVPIAQVYPISCTTEAGLTKVIDGLRCVFERMTMTGTSSAVDSDGEGQSANTQGSADEEERTLALGANMRHRGHLTDCLVLLRAFLHIAGVALRAPTSADPAADGELTLRAQALTQTLLANRPPVTDAERLHGRARDIVLDAELLREAADAFGRMTGRGDAIDVEEVLGKIFGDFCVGK